MMESGLRQELENFSGLFKTFELLLSYRRRLNMADDHLATALCNLYAVWSACEIRGYIGSIGGLETASIQEGNEKSSETNVVLPQYETLKRFTQDLLDAVAIRDKIAVSAALKEMGIFALCPAPEQLFSRMESATSRINGRAQQVFLVELSLFAVKVGDYERARTYIQHVRTFEPSSRELYDICVLDGLIALNDGKIGEAVQCLARSMKACQADVDASVKCSLLFPNLELAKKLLERGERQAVLNHLLDCHNVWQRHRPQIEEWIHVVENEGSPDFHFSEAVGKAGQPAYRLNIQWMRVCTLETQQGPIQPDSQMSPAEVLAGRERLIADVEPFLNARIMKKIEYLEKDLAASPDQPSSFDPAA
jgi:hypothetical protein